MTEVINELAYFDGEAFIQTLDERRQERGLTWTRLADELWMQSSELNERLGGDALCPGALYRTSLRKTMSCQYALPLLRWLERAPEDFLDGQVVDVGDASLPSAGPDKRLRWDLSELYAAVDSRRRELELTWVALGEQIGCTPSRLTNLRTARLADLGLVMQLTQWLHQPAARFIHPSDF
jgi:hypothetical protein